MIWLFCRAAKSKPARRMSTAVPVAWIERTEKFNEFVYERQLKEEWKTQGDVK
jgi:hypothetical protein